MSEAVPQRSRALPARRVLADEVYDAVVAMIMDRDIEPGERVSIDRLARELNVSPTPVREALARIESEGLVLKQPLKGYTATPVLDEDGLRQLFEMRGLIEPFAAARAAIAIAPEQAERLREIVATMGEDIEEAALERFEGYRDFVLLDASFHRIIAEASGNLLLADTLHRLRPHLHQYRVYLEHHAIAETVEEHLAICQAVVAGDPDGASAAMQEHLDRSYVRIAAG